MVTTSSKAATSMTTTSSAGTMTAPITHATMSSPVHGLKPPGKLNDMYSIVAIKKHKSPVMLMSLPFAI